MQVVRIQCCVNMPPCDLTYRTVLLKPRVIHTVTYCVPRGDTCDVMSHDGYELQHATITPYVSKYKLSNPSLVAVAALAVRTGTKNGSVSILAVPETAIPARLPGVCCPHLHLIFVAAPARRHHS